MGLDDSDESPGDAEGGADPGGEDDSPVAACAREVTEANKATVQAAIDELFVQGDVTAVDRYWGEPYLQHNPIAASEWRRFAASSAGS